MRKSSVCRHVLHSVLALASAAFFVHSAFGEESPYATGGEVTVRQFRDYVTSYIHVFTNTAEAASFASTGLRDLELRYLVVGAGGAGGDHNGGSAQAGGGGGGGGVCEKSQIPFAIGSTWQITVGKGATKWAEVAGASAISNGVADVETVPGGGNGAKPVTSSATKYYYATTGAAGGGGAASGASATTYKKGAAGTYPSSIFGVVPEGAPFAGATIASTRAGGGGGGAAAAGKTSSANSGGEGLASDITGEVLVYGAGGGGGAGANEGTDIYYQGGLGGSRAGDGSYYANENGDYTTKAPTNKTPAAVAYARAVAATDAEPNSGGGGGGALGPNVSGKNGFGKGADGIVVIRYDIWDSPCEGGDILTKRVDGLVTTWIHQFTNVAPDLSQGGMLKFKNLAGRDLKVRYLVVGAGGAGGRYSDPGTYYGGGGGGGGGGVCEKANIPFANGAIWQITVGKGGKMAATSKPEESCGGTSTISNDAVDVETVPGGGGGASSKDGKANAYPAQDGASGGGANVTYKTGAEGTYTNSIFGVEYGPFDGGYNKSAGAPGSGGGGASEAGLNQTSQNSPDGGEGLVSDITGEPLVYGSGGGGGCARKSTTNIYNGGEGGTRAGNGAKYKIVTADDGTKTTNFFAATEGAANSGGGGGGGASMLVSGTGTTFAPTPGADGIVVISYKVYSDECPCEGGDVVTRTLVRGTRYIYRHYFTDTRMANQFINRTDRDLKLRYLVVGAGGSGGAYYSGNTEGGGGGGGGGGVCEKSGVPFAVGSAWQITVGKGSGGSAVAGASSISNGVTDVETVPGGGNGASGSGTAATSGAAGGGGKRTAGTAGAAGTYVSSVLGVSPENAPFKGGNNSSSRAGGGGGGAGSAGLNSATVGIVAPTVRGGEGLVSDITGEPLVYGSGGGGGCGKNTTPSFYQGGLGGTRAGNGGYFDLVDWTNVTYAATDAEPNSGGGGGGAAGYGDNARRGKGADGIVIIRYVYDPNPSGLLLMVR